MTTNPGTGRDIAKIAVKLVVGVLILALMLYKVDVAKLTDAFREADYGYVYLGFLAFLLMGLFEALRIYTALRSYPLTVAQSVGLYFTSTFVSNFVPGTVGAEVYKVFYLRRLEPGLKKPIALMLMLKATGVATLAVMAGIYIAVNYGHVASEFAANRWLWRIDVSNYSAFLTVAAVAVVVILVVALAGIRTRYDRIRKAALEYWQTISGISGRQYVTISCIAVLVHVARAASFYLYVRAFGENIFSPDLIVVSAFVVLASFLPISFASLGVREGAVVAGLYVFGVSQPNAMAVAVVSRAALVAVSIIGGFLLLAGRRAGKRAVT